MQLVDVSVDIFFEASGLADVDVGEVVEQAALFLQTPQQAVEQVKTRWIGVAGHEAREIEKGSRHIDRLRRCRR